MGNEKSSPKVTQNGDHDINIINTQEVHTNFHIDHEQKLLIIMILVIIQLSITVYKLLAKREKRKVIRNNARSMANLNEIAVQ